MYLLWLNAKVFLSPNSQEKPALWEEVFILWLYVPLVFDQIPSIQTPQFEKHGDRKLSMELGLGFLRVSTQGQFNQYVLNGFYISRAVLEGSASWSDASLIWMQECQGPGSTERTDLSDCLKEAGKNMTSTQDQSWKE